MKIKKEDEDEDEGEGEDDNAFPIFVDEFKQQMKS